MYQSYKPRRIGRVARIRGELVLLDSKEYTYPLRCHPDSAHQEIRSYGSQAELVRRPASKGESWLVLRSAPYLGLPEKDWKRMAKGDEGALTYTGKLVKLDVEIGEDLVSAYIDW